MKREAYEKLKAENERLREAWVDKKMEQDRDALLAENERLKSTIEAIYRIDPLLKEAVASAMLAAKEVRDAK